jgi:hypothetical protein
MAKKSVTREAVDKLLQEMFNCDDTDQRLPRSEKGILQGFCEAMDAFELGGVEAYNELLPHFPKNAGHLKARLNPETKAGKSSRAFQKRTIA